MATEISTPNKQKNHPIRGGLYGILLGLGMALVLIGQKTVTLDSIMPIVVIVLGIVLGIVWGIFAPAKKPKGSEPVRPAEDMAQPPEAVAEDV